MKIKILANLVYYFVKALNLTYRYQFIGLENKSQARSFNNKQSYVYALWHQNLIGAIFSHINERFSMVISESKDGELVAVTCQKFGHLPARGSSTRGGKKALIEIVRNISNGFPGALTVDGPKGPAKEVKPGIIEIAKLTQVAILPLSPYSNNHWVIKKSWDQFRVPRPFSKIVVVIGAPIKIDRNLPKEQYEDYSYIIKSKLEEGETLAKAYFEKN